MVETFAERLLQGPSRDAPLVLASARAYLECGCHVFVGKRLDTLGHATAAASCSAKHDPLIQDFLRLQAENPFRGKPADLPAHVSRLLEEARGAVRRR